MLKGNYHHHSYVIITLFFFYHRHDVTEGTRDLIKDTTSNIKSLAQYQTSDPKKTVRKRICLKKKTKCI
jgi:hypothetical protein